MKPRARCPNCETTTDTYRPLVEVKNLAAKLEHYIGDEVPAGQCSTCSSFVYSVDVDRAGDAIGVLQKDYWSDVIELAESLKDDIKDGGITDQDQLQNRLHKDCDGAQRVIYTQWAKLALVFSDNDDAYEAEYGGTMPEWSQLAYCAFYRDVQERLDDIMTCERCSNKFATVDYDSEDLCQECYEEALEDEKEAESDKE